MEIIIKKERRQSLRLSVKQQNILCQVPINTSSKEIDSFLSLNNDWINKQQKVTKILYPNFLSDTKMLWLGQWLDIVVSKGKPDLIIDKQVVVCWDGDKDNKYYLKKLEKIQKEKLYELIKKCTSSHPITYNELKIKKMNASYGRCHSNGNLSFSTRLSHYPIEFIEMVVAHELAHCIEMNHSPAFYKVLKSLYPNYDVIHKQYKHYLQEVTYD